MPLILEVRLPFSNKWLRISPEQARTYYEEKDQIDYGSLRRGLLKQQRESRNSVSANLTPLRLLQSSGRLGGGSSLASLSESSSDPRRMETTNTGAHLTQQAKKKWVVPPSRRRSSDRSSTQWHQATNPDNTNDNSYNSIQNANDHVNKYNEI